VLLTPINKDSIDQFDLRAMSSRLCDGRVAGLHRRIDRLCAHRRWPDRPMSPITSF